MIAHHPQKIKQDTSHTKGITLPPVDVTIAAIAVQNDLPLFTRDGHFETVALHSDLLLYR